MKKHLIIAVIGGLLFTLLSALGYSTAGSIVVILTMGIVLGFMTYK